MALILNLETATKACSVALGRDGELLAIKESVDQQYSHAEQLNQYVQDVLDTANLKLSDLDAVALSHGPGSYTGLRIGSSSAKGFCFALDIPMLSISTHRAMFLGMQKQQKADIYCPMIDARRMEVYVASYSDAGEMKEKVEAKILDGKSYQNELNASKVLFAGDGAEKCKELFGSHANSDFLDGFHPSAQFMVELSEMAFTKNDFADVAYFEPFYLKDFVAGKPKKLV